MSNTFWGMEITADQLLIGFGDTLYMVAISLLFSALIGLTSRDFCLSLLEKDISWTINGFSTS